MLYNNPPLRAVSKLRAACFVTAVSAFMFGPTLAALASAGRVSCDRNEAAYVSYMILIGFAFIDVRPAPRRGPQTRCSVGYLRAPAAGGLVRRGRQGGPRLRLRAGRRDHVRTRADTVLGARPRPAPLHPRVQKHDPRVDRSLHSRTSRCRRLVLRRGCCPHRVVALSAYTPFFFSTHPQTRAQKTPPRARSTHPTRLISCFFFRFLSLRNLMPPHGFAQILRTAGGPVRGLMRGPVIVLCNSTDLFSSASEFERWLEENPLDEGQSLICIMCAPRALARARNCLFFPCAVRESLSSTPSSGAACSASAN